MILKVFIMLFFESMLSFVVIFYRVYSCTLLCIILARALPFCPFVVCLLSKMRALFHNKQENIKLYFVIIYLFKELV